MEYQKKTKKLAPNQLSYFRTKNWVKVNDEARGTYNINSQIKFRTSMIIGYNVIIGMHMYL